MAEPTGHSGRYPYTLPDLRRRRSISTDRREPAVTVAAGRDSDTAAACIAVLSRVHDETVFSL